MAFKATNQIPAEAYRRVKNAAINLKNSCTAYVAFLAANSVDYDYFREIYLTLKNANAQFTELKGTQGILQYAKDQEDDQNYDIDAEFTTMQATIALAGSWMEANIPTDVTALTPSNWTGATMISDVVAPASTSVLRTRLTAVANSIS